MLLNASTLCLLFSFVAAGYAGSGYVAEIEAWRKARVERLLADDGWFTVAGLFWLKDGSSSFGTDPRNDIVLPVGSAPGHAGEFRHDNGRTTVVFAPGVVGTVNGNGGVSRAALATDATGSPDTVVLGRLSMMVIERGDRYGVRLRDKEAPARRAAAAAGLHYFAVVEAYRVIARFVPDAKSLSIANVLGQIQPYRSPGYVELLIGGRELRLRPVLESDDARELFFIFRDETSGRETYGAGRFLYTDLPRDGRVVLDFNKAVNPPCAYTPYATCPLPPPENRLPVRIEAGERDYGKH
jgi:hypothetical protein